MHMKQKPCRNFWKKTVMRSCRFREGADVYVINTCTVTNMADRKSRQMLHKARKMNPDAIVVAAGCYVQTENRRKWTIALTL